MCSSSLSIPRELARVAEYAMSMEMACPWRRGTSGISSCNGDQLSRCQLRLAVLLVITYVCPYAITRSSPISCRLGVSSFNISWIPALLMASAALSTFAGAPSVRPKPVLISCSQCWSSNLKVGKWAQDEILISSANPLRICASGRVRRNVKSKKVFIGA